MSNDTEAPPLIVWLITLLLLAMCAVGIVAYHLFVGDMFLLLSLNMSETEFVS